MKTKKLISLSLAVVFAATIFEGCKKGEEDPFISFKSRKGRVTGEWNTVSGTRNENSTFTTGNGFTITEKEVADYDGTKETEVETVTTTNDQGSVTETDTEIDYYTLKFTFDDEGNFTSVKTETDPNDSAWKETTTLKGTWNFTEGIGDDLSDKEQLLLNYTDVVVSEVDGGTTTTENSKVYFTDIWKLIRLANDEIIMELSYDTDRGDVALQYTLEKTENL